MDEPLNPNAQNPIKRDLTRGSMLSGLNNLIAVYKRVSKNLPPELQQEFQDAVLVIAGVIDKIANYLKEK
jgi:hypothetical protein